ncbi:MAG: hypothetical protein O2971_16795 [Proteobacteria bacterium]|nr:hypothetical protein [Pseudomonadota bacterium]
MALKRRNTKEDLEWLKWPLVWLLISILAAVVLYLGTDYIRDEIRMDELNASAGLDVISEQVSAIEVSEQIIVDNIDRYNTMVANRVMEEEGRVALLDEISIIRERFQLFPISVEISEQDRILLAYPEEVEFPDEQISLRSSRVQVQIPLLHEEDLVRFLSAFLRDGRLMVVNRCALSDTPVLEEDILRVVPHQVATCEFYWYTLRNEPYSGV